MEIWKDIKDYEGIYQVSNLGNVKSLKHGKEKILKPSDNSHGYFKVNLSKDGVRVNLKIHVLVSIAFLNHKPNGLNLVVNHKDFNKQNNVVENLEIVTNRENSNHKHIKHSSKYTGVSWCKQTSKWRACIYIDKKLRCLGRFKNEYEAYLAYENELKLISLENG